MYPVTLIRVSRNRTISVTMKNREEYTGTLIDCDLKMNIALKNVMHNGRSMDNCILKGTSIDSVRLAKNVFTIQNNFDRKAK